MVQLVLYHSIQAMQVLTICMWLKTVLWWAFSHDKVY